MSASWALLITCEHGGNAVPPEFARLFADRHDLLASHRGFDRGALETAQCLADRFGAPLFAATVTRLVVDLNRSIGHPGLFSELTKPLAKKEKYTILAAYYQPHREAVSAAIASRLAAGDRVLHIASHSFTPVLDGVRRHCDVGFLYDPGREEEKTFCRGWMRELARHDAGLVLRRNYPYRGVADGLVTSLRRRFGAPYAGVELEVNQRFALSGRAVLTDMSEALAASLRSALARI